MQKQRPKWNNLSLTMKIIAAGVAPLAFGGITGYALGESATVYIVLLVLSIIGGVAAGFEHDTPLQGAGRGLWGGLLFASAILMAHTATGSTALIKLPEPTIVFIVINVVAGTLLGALGGRLSRRAALKAA